MAKELHVSTFYNADVSTSFNVLTIMHVLIFFYLDQLFHVLLTSMIVLIQLQSIIVYD